MRAKYKIKILNGLSIKSLNVIKCNFPKKKKSNL